MYSCPPAETKRVDNGAVEKDTLGAIPQAPSTESVGSTLQNSGTEKSGVKSPDEETLGVKSPDMEISKSVPKTSDTEKPVVEQPTDVVNNGLSVADLQGLSEYEKSSPDGDYRIGDFGKVVVSNSGVKRELTLVSTLTRIPRNAFRRKALTSVDIPNSVTYIGYAAFAYNSLISVSIPDSVTVMAAWAFADNALESVSISKSIDKIAGFAFRNNKLTSVIIPNLVSSISEGAFLGNMFESLVIPKFVTSIGILAFADNSFLTTVVLPKTLFDKLSSDELNDKFGGQVKEYKDFAGKALVK